MTTGTERLLIIAAVTYNGEAVAVNISEQHKDAWDGIYLVDNGFNEEQLPKKPGLYVLDCELYWDDGANFWGERTDPDWDYTVLSVSQIY